MERNYVVTLLPASDDLQQGKIEAFHAAADIFHFNSTHKPGMLPAHGTPPSSLLRRRG
jgi:hypothetical protein